MISPATTDYLETHQAGLVEKGILVDPYMPVHPTFLYESVWCLLGFVLLLAYQKHRRFHGEVFLMYIIWYGAGRAVIEGMRTDPLMLGGLRVSQAVAVTTALAGVVVWAVARWKTGDKPLVIPEIPPRAAASGEDGGGAEEGGGDD
jgi:phosphatidylglycerol:prolipoprotein diacylglycerol transferase